MNAAITLVSDQDPVLAYLDEARKHHTQMAIAKHLGVGVRTISRWEARQTHPPAYLAHALQQLLPFGEERPAGAFDFIDLLRASAGCAKHLNKSAGCAKHLNKSAGVAYSPANGTATHQKTTPKTSPTGIPLPETSPKCRQPTFPITTYCWRAFPAHLSPLPGGRRKKSWGR